MAKPTQLPLNMPESPARIESGLLQIFRAYTLIQWVILGLSLFSLGNEDSDVGMSVIIIVMFIHSLFLLIYLSLERLQTWFRRAYLPLAIIGATLAPIFAQTLAVFVRLDAGMSGRAVANDPNSLLLWFFTPVIVVGAQYGLRGLLTFLLTTSIIDIYFAVRLARGGILAFDTSMEGLVIRNIVFLAVGFIIARLITEQRRQRQSLHEVNAQLTQMAVTLEQLAVSRERNRLARDLHDTLAHTLSAVAIQLEAVMSIWEQSPDVARQRIERIQEITRDGLSETRHALKALRSNPLDDLGLVMALQLASDQASTRAGFTLHTDLPETNPELPHEIALNLVRITEEALNNVVRHAEASHVWVSLTAEDNTLHLKIRDNGRGFATTDSTEGHYGLIGMYERAVLCGASLTVDSEPHFGTTIQFSVKDV